jgi:arylsulfatase A-like enzyme
MLNTARVAQSAAVAVVASLGLATGSARRADAQATPAARAPSLIVFITVDQMREDYFERFSSQLTGGLGRLYKGGAFFTNAFHDHAITETAPGHSVTMSGRFPAHTNIVMNSVGVPDPKSPLIGGGGPGASPFRFRGTVLIDWLRAKDSASRALSVSRKDRGAILPLGRAKQSVFWYSTTGRFTTSTYYADTLPAWVNQFNDRKIPQTYAGKAWNLLLPPDAYREPDSIPIENFGQNFVFPHPFPGDPDQTARLFTEFPPMDSLTAQFALAGLQAMDLGRGPHTDIVATSYSTTDAVGHRYGPDSRELHDQILRLDKYLGIFIDSLYKIRDSSTIVFALTADHGTGPYPELRAAREHKRAQRANISPTILDAMARLEVAGADSATLHFEDGIIWIDREKASRAGVKADSVLDALAKALRKVDGIGRVDFVKDLAKNDTTKDAVARRWLHMLPPDLPADLVVSLAPYAYYASVTMSTHGTPNDYDAHVPVVFYGPWFTPGKYSQKALVADMAPTLAAVAGVTPTERLDGRVRTEAIKKP